MCQTTDTTEISMHERGALAGQEVHPGAHVVAPYSESLYFLMHEHPHHEEEASTLHAPAPH